MKSGDAKRIKRLVFTPESLSAPERKAALAALDAVREDALRRAIEVLGDASVSSPGDKLTAALLLTLAGVVRRAPMGDE